MSSFPASEDSQPDVSIDTQLAPPAEGDGWIPMAPPTGLDWSPDANPLLEPGVSPAQMAPGAPAWYAPAPGPLPHHQVRAVPLPALDQRAHRSGRGSLLLVAALCALIGAGTGAGAGAFAALSLVHPSSTSSASSPTGDSSVITAVVRPTPAPTTAPAATTPAVTAPPAATTAPAAPSQAGSTTASGSTTTPAAAAATTTLTIEQLAAAAAPSVVTIDATTTVGSRFGGLGQVSDTGSGLIVRSDGWILTNRHVVGTAKTVKVLFSDGTSVQGTVKAVDSSTDFALVKVATTGLTAATLGDSSTVKVGEPVVAIGSPLGQFTGTVTSGIISGLDRSITVSEGNSPVGTNLDHLIQTDAAINPGNSGGPLFDMQGNVIGINTAEAGNAQNIGFALPINLAQVFITATIG